MPSDPAGSIHLVDDPAPVQALAAGPGVRLTLEWDGRRYDWRRLVRSFDRAFLIGLVTYGVVGGCLDRLRGRR